MSRDRLQFRVAVVGLCFLVAVIGWILAKYATSVSAQDQGTVYDVTRGSLSLADQTVTVGAVAGVVASASSDSLAVRTEPPSTEDDYVEVVHNLGTKRPLTNVWFEPSSGDYDTLTVDGGGQLAIVGWDVNTIRVYNNTESAIKVWVEVLKATP